MTVFANKLEVSCKAQDNKVIAAFPDVCMTPPENPATPPGVPIPYPNFGMDTDTDKGTSTVKIGGKTVNQKNSSHFTKTTGDEAGAAAKKGVISSKNTGKAYSQAFSMNVKAQGKNLTRFSDIQTNNHGSPPNVVPWPKIASPHMPGGVDPCEGDKQKADDACKDQDGIDEACADAGLDKAIGKRGETNKNDGYNTTVTIETTTFGDGGAVTETDSFQDNDELLEMSDKAQKNPCLQALACVLPPKGGSGENSNCPCKGQTGHHMVPASGFFNKGRGEPPNPANGEFPLDVTDKIGAPSYEANSAPCVCAEGRSNTTGSHGMMHTEMNAFLANSARPNTSLPVVKKSQPVIIVEMQDGLQSMNYNEIRDESIRNHAKIFPLSDCSPACLKAQLDSYHCDELQMDENTPLRSDKAGKSSKAQDAAVDYNELRRQWLTGPIN